MTVEDDRIEQLKRKLYSRDGVIPTISTDFKIQQNVVDEVKDDWSTELHIDDVPYEQPTHPFLKKFFGASLIFFLGALAVAGYMFFMGTNEVSSANVDIVVVGPASVTSGEQVDLGLSLRNKNRTTLHDIVLTIEYPEGTRAQDNSAEPLKRTTEQIASLAKDAEYNTTAKFYVFGDKDVPKTLTIKMEYSVTGSAARFTKEKKYDVLIGSSPLLINVSAPQEINSGQQVSMQVTVTSNSTSLLKDVLVRAEYPYGFTYNRATLEPESDKQTWKIGDLKNGDKKVFTVIGSVLAQDNEERTFRFLAGVANLEGDIETVLGTAMPTISVRKPFFNTVFSLDGDVSDVVGTKANTRVSAQMAVTNSLPDSLSNVVLEVKMSGAALNKSGVRVGNGGFYQSSQNVIVWDRNTDSSFDFMRPGDKVTTRFDLENFSVSQTMKNPEITFEVTLKGVRSLVGGGVDNVVSTVTKKLKFFTDITLAARSLRLGTLQNTGPVPPQRDTPTTYTIEWVLSNTHNDVQKSQVQTVLPVYVEWMGVVSPSTESVIYNPDTRTVTWNAGTIGAGAGYLTSPKKVLFQVKINPSVSQVGLSPALTGDLRVSGMDTFVGKAVVTDVAPVTTNTADGFSGVVQ